jgi:hypothetical protein
MLAQRQLSSARSARTQPTPRFRATAHRGGATPGPARERVEVLEALVHAQLADSICLGVAFGPGGATLTVRTRVDAARGRFAYAAEPGQTYLGVPVRLHASGMLIDPRSGEYRWRTSGTLGEVAWAGAGSLVWQPFAFTAPGGESGYAEPAYAVAIDGVTYDVTGRVAYHTGIGGDGESAGELTLARGLRDARPARLATFRATSVLSAEGWAAGTGGGSSRACPLTVAACGRWENPADAESGAAKVSLDIGPVRRGLAGLLFGRRRPAA